MRLLNQGGVLTQGRHHVYMPVDILHQGTGTPLLGEGDPAGSYYVLARTGVGTYTLTTKDPFKALLLVDISFLLATAVPGWSSAVVPLQNANNTWTLTLTTYLSGTATDLAASPFNVVCCDIRFRASGSTP